MTEPLYPTNHYSLWAESVEHQRKKLKPVTWCLGDAPCRTLRGPITWTDKRKGR